MCGLKYLGLIRPSGHLLMPLHPCTGAPWFSGSLYVVHCAPSKAARAIYGAVSVCDCEKIWDEHLQLTGLRFPYYVLKKI